MHREVQGQAVRMGLGSDDACRCSGAFQLNPAPHAPCYSWLSPLSTGESPRPACAGERTSGVKELVRGAAQATELQPEAIEDGSAPFLTGESTRECTSRC